MRPTDLGLPAKFPTFRPGQYATAVDLAASEKRFSLLAAPPGSGKSLIYMAVAKLLGPSTRTLILTGTKGLQRQLLSDFSSIGLLDIRGQSNYRCVALDDKLSQYGVTGAGCNDGPCHVGVDCDLRNNGCHYYDTVALAKDSNLVITNYAYWLAQGRYSDPLALGDFDLLVLDEAHRAADWLVGFCAISLSKPEIKDLLAMELPPATEGLAAWAEWAVAARQAAKDEYSRVQTSGTDKRSRIKTLLRLSVLGRDLDALFKSPTSRSEAPRRDAKVPGMVTDWVTSDSARTATLAPVWGHAYAEPYLFRGIPRVLLSSATLSPESGRYLGIPPDDADFHEVESTFPSAHRPIIYIPTTRVDHRMQEGNVRQWISRIDQIVGGRLDRKGIIHTHSYARAVEVLKRSKHADIMLTHTSRLTRAVVDEFLRAFPPAVLVSPAVEEGWDFAGTDCEYQIIAKLPFLDTRGPIEQARVKSDKGYSNHVTAQTIVQMSGRPVRSSDDRAETFIIDDHWRWFRKRGTFPKWFKQAWQVCGAVPSPPQPIRRN